MLLEVERDGHIRFATGAVQTLTGLQPAALDGCQLTDLLDPMDRGAIAAALEHLGDAERLLPLGVRLRTSGSEAMIMTGCRLPHSERVHLSLRLAAPGEAVPTRDGPSGLLDEAAFSAAIGERWRSDPQASLTFIELAGLQEVGRDLDDDEAERLPRRLGRLLREAANDGLAGRVAAERFGLMHAKDLNVAQLEQELIQVLHDVHPASANVTATSRSIPLSTDGLSDVDADKAVRFAIQCFASRPGMGPDFPTLNDGFAMMLEETVGKIVSYRGALADDQLSLVFQPIVRLENHLRTHYEALSRTKEGVAPARLLDFAEAIDLVAEFDLLVCQRVLDILRTSRRHIAIAVNLSARSIQDRLFVSGLITLLAGAEELRRRLLFEITETAEVQDFDWVDRVVRDLRQQGCRVGLDDFGAGAMAFHYLRRLEVDFVKLDGALVRSADHRDRAVLRSVVQLCRDLHIETIAEMVESPEQANRLRSLRVDMAQGHLFGRPSADFT